MYFGHLNGFLFSCCMVRCFRTSSMIIGMKGEELSIASTYFHWRPRAERRISIWARRSVRRGRDTTKIWEAMERVLDLLTLSADVFWPGLLELGWEMQYLGGWACQILPNLELLVRNSDVPALETPPLKLINKKIQTSIVRPRETTNIGYWGRCGNLMIFRTELFVSRSKMSRESSLSSES